MFETYIKVLGLVDTSIQLVEDLVDNGIRVHPPSSMVADPQPLRSERFEREIDFEFSIDFVGSKVHLHEIVD